MTLPMRASVHERRAFIKKPTGTFTGREVPPFQQWLCLEGTGGSRWPCPRHGRRRWACWGSGTCTRVSAVDSLWIRFDSQLTEPSGGFRSEESGGSESGTASPRPGGRGAPSRGSHRSPPSAAGSANFLARARPSFRLCGSIRVAVLCSAVLQKPHRWTHGAGGSVPVQLY